MSSENNVKVTKIRKVDDYGHLKAYVDIVVCKFLVVRNCRIMDGVNGLFVSLPHEPGAKEGKYFPVNKPYTKEAYKDIKETILAAYNSEATKLAQV
jgi:stage V sporulation protein G